MDDLAAQAAKKAAKRFIPLPYHLRTGILRYRSVCLKFFEINLLGVYVAPMSILMLAAWLATLALLRVAGRFGLLRLVWHPALFVLAIYMIALSSMVLAIAR
jgi:hypothetical protein